MPCLHLLIFGRTSSEAARLRLAWPWAVQTAREAWHPRGDISSRPAPWPPAPAGGACHRLQSPQRKLPVPRWALLLVAMLPLQQAASNLWFGPGAVAPSSSASVPRSRQSAAAASTPGPHGEPDAAAAGVGEASEGMAAHQHRHSDLPPKRCARCWQGSRRLKRVLRSARSMCCQTHWLPC